MSHFVIVVIVVLCIMYRKHGISHYNPQMPEWNTRYIPLEAAVKDGCRLLIYVITEDTRAMTSMIEVWTLTIVLVCNFLNRGLSLTVVLLCDRHYKGLSLTTILV